ncbi:acyl-CoA thioesterase domain-containing protein [Saccharopolyspora cebuensis]|uniref:Acyl-CoA thioesterase domain-containing protein n=1 Tax=Saccharopolyspora cebuensis TaxID=418759 RepID=A0ABV4CMN6_9PSEU
MAGTDDAVAFFTAEAEHLVPAAHANSPWAPEMLHGRLLGGLLARELERAHGDPELHFTRLTVDLFRNTGMVPVRVDSERVRDGRRIRVADATAYAGGRPVARASAVLLRRTGQPAGAVRATPAWDAPTPDELGPAPRRHGEWPVPFDAWLLDDAGVPSTWDDGRVRRAWLRERHPLVDGEPTSPFVRAALAADFASPLAHFGDRGLEFINADYTLVLGRSPQGEAIGLEAAGHISEDGVAVGDCTVHDTSGPLGHCTVTAVANRTP